MSAPWRAEPDWAAAVAHALNRICIAHNIPDMFLPEVVTEFRKNARVAHYGWDCNSRTWRKLGWATRDFLADRLALERAQRDVDGMLGRQVI